jgi:hypothetical protein
VRVIKKVDPSAPHAVLLVLDATVGQNALSQVEIFSKAVGVTGLVMTKLDGTARGGILGRHRGEVQTAGAFHRRRRKRRRSRAVFGARFRACDRRASMRSPSHLGAATHRRNDEYETAAQPAPQARVRPRAAGPVLLCQFALRHFRRHRDVHGRGAGCAGRFLRADAALPIMPVVTAIIVLVFGGLTLFLHNDSSSRSSRPSSTRCSARCCSADCYFGKPLSGVVFDSMFHLTDEGWRKLTLRWALFFLRARRAQRDRLAQYLDQRLGELQGVRRSAADLPVRRAAICRC